MFSVEIGTGGREVHKFIALLTNLFFVTLSKVKFFVKFYANICIGFRLKWNKLIDRYKQNGIRTVFPL